MKTSIHRESLSRFNNSTESLFPPAGDLYKKFNAPVNFSNDPGSCTKDPDNFSNDPDSFTNHPDSFTNHPDNFLNDSGSRTNRSDSFINDSGSRTNRSDNFTNDPDNFLNEINSTKRGIFPRKRAIFDVFKDYTVLKEVNTVNGLVKQVPPYRCLNN